MKTFYQTTPMNAYMKPVEVAPESWGGYVRPSGTVETAPPAVQPGLWPRWVTTVPRWRSDYGSSYSGQWQLQTDSRSVPVYSTLDGSAYQLDWLTDLNYAGVGELPSFLTDLPRPSPDHVWKNSNWIPQSQAVSKTVYQMSPMNAFLYTLEIAPLIDGSYSLPYGAVAVAPPTPQSGVWPRWHATVDTSNPGYGQPGSGSWQLEVDRRKVALYYTADGQQYMGNWANSTVYAGVGPLPDTLTDQPRPSPDHVWKDGAWVLEIAPRTFYLTTPMNAYLQPIDVAPQPDGSFVAPSGAVTQAPPAAQPGVWPLWVTTVHRSSSSFGLSGTGQWALEQDRRSIPLYSTLDGSVYSLDWLTDLNYAGVGALPGFLTDLPRPDYVWKTSGWIPQEQAVSKTVYHLTASSVFMYGFEVVMASDGSFSLPSRAVAVAPPTPQPGLWPRWHSLVDVSDPSYGRPGSGSWQLEVDRRRVPLYYTIDGTPYIENWATSTEYIGVGPLPDTLTDQPRPSPLHVWKDGAWVLETPAGAQG